MNVFLGEPSDAIISHLDKRYYKHTVDAMNIDVSACYKVCEEKSAVIPAEKPHQIFRLQYSPLKLDIQEEILMFL